VSCPACGSAITLRGHVASRFGECRFVPSGLRWFVLQRSLSLRDPLLHACLSCGQVWGTCDPARLRALVDASASEALLDDLRRRAEPSFVQRALSAPVQCGCCPACGESVTVPGRAEGKDVGSFLPNGLRFLAWSSAVPLIHLPGSALLRACSGCGHVWGVVDGTTLLALVRSSGTDDLRAELRRLGALLP
jgi:hypothetical protein